MHTIRQSFVIHVNFFMTLFIYNQNKAFKLFTVHYLHGTYRGYHIENLDISIFLLWRVAWDQEVYNIVEISKVSI